MHRSSSILLIPNNLITIAYRTTVIPYLIYTLFRKLISNNFTMSKLNKTKQFRCSQLHNKLSDTIRAVDLSLTPIEIELSLKYLYSAMCVHAIQSIFK